MNKKTEQENLKNRRQTSIIMICLLIGLVYVLIQLDTVHANKLITLNINGLVDSYVTKSETIGELVDELSLGTTVIQINPDFDAPIENKLLVSIITESQKANQTITNNLEAAKIAALPPKPAKPQPFIPEIEPEPKSPNYFGWATWYKQFDGFYAASRIFPRGSRLKVVSVASGKSVIVKVNDYGPEEWTGVSIDLNDFAFKELAPLGAGKIYVKFYLI